MTDALGYCVQCDEETAHAVAAHHTSVAKAWPALTIVCRVCGYPHLVTAVVLAEAYLATLKRKEINRRSSTIIRERKLNNTTKE